MRKFRQEEAIESAIEKQAQSIGEMKKSFEKQEESIDEIKKSMAQILQMYASASTHFSIIFPRFATCVHLNKPNCIPFPRCPSTSVLK